MSEAPERIWAWWDDAYDVGLLNEHGDKRYTPNDAKEYVRADRIEELEANLAEQIEWVRGLADDLIAAEGREARLKEKLAKAVEEAEKYKHAFAAQSRKLQAVLHIDGVRATLAELKGINQ